MAKLDLNDGQFRPSIDGIENGKTSQVTGMNRILNFIQGNINYLKSLVDSKANRTLNINAGNGLQGGGNLTADRTINVASADDSITVGADNIKVNTYNGVDSTSVTRPGSAKAVKQANDNANGRVSKTGDEMTGGLIFNNVAIDQIVVKQDDINKMIFGYSKNTGSVYLRSGESTARLELKNNGSVMLTSNDLLAEDKNVVYAINESLWRIVPKDIGSTTEAIDLNTIYKAGFYNSQSNNNIWLNKPVGLTTNAFELIVTGLEPNKEAYTTQILKSSITNEFWVRTQKYRSSIEWTEWDSLALNSTLWKIAYKRIAQSGNEDLNNVVDFGFYATDYATDKIANNPLEKTTGISGGIGVIVLPNANPSENRLRAQMVYDRDGNIAYRFMQSNTFGTEYIASPDLLWGMLNMPDFSAIQTVGTKEAGKIYWDRTVKPKKPYLCLQTTTDTQVTSKFVKFDLSDICNKLYSMNNKFPRKQTVFTYNGTQQAWQDTTIAQIATANLIQVSVQASDWTDNRNNTWLLANNGSKEYIQIQDNDGYTVYSINFINGEIKHEANNGGGGFSNNVIREIVKLY